ncbi:MAG: hypothetical protein O3A03_00560 [Proteobacteria bacterium]|nr:hypothetical protein [Pseudomonadota bacterium]MDA0941705.1 hypothetical protein [Pseudomonadota bacterium]MDA1034138.1 hypothetical protein [Pseudomonadota bacterium]
MNYFKLTKSWISQIFDILRCTKNNSLIIGYTYLFIFLVLPSLPLIQFLSPIVIILWPIAVVQIVVFYHASQDKKIKFLSLDPKIKKKIPQLVRVGLITFFYALVISSILSPQMQVIVEQTNLADNAIELSVFVKLLVKLFLLMLPLFAATWFSPMIIVFQNQEVLKSLKSSVASILIYLIPLVMTWLCLVIIFAGSLYATQSILMIFNFSQNIFMGISTIIIFSLTSIYVAALFIFQYLSYKEIFKL